MNMKTLHFLVLLLLTILSVSYSLPTYAGGGGSLFISVDTKSDPNFAFLKQDIKKGLIYKGLPKAMGESERLEQEKKKPHFQKKDDYFYKDPAEINVAFIDHIKRALTKNNAVRAYPKMEEGGLGVVKFCGGFHADYMITLHTETQKIDMQICYGCGDMRLFIDDVFINEYDMHTEYIFKEWTAPYADLGSTKEE